MAARSQRVVTWGRLAMWAVIVHGKLTMKKREQAEEVGRLQQDLQEDRKEVVEASEVREEEVGHEWE